MATRNCPQCDCEISDQAKKCPECVSDIANESRYGLSAYVFTKDMRRMMRLVRELKFGEIYVNKQGGDVVQAHHAGIRDSGIGGEDGKYGLDAYFQKKTIYVNFA